MRNPLGYKVLRTYQQGEEIYQLTKKFTAEYLHTIKDSRLISHMNDSARSVPRNIAEGYGRNNTKQYYEFLGFSFGSLLELLEDNLELEREIKGGQRITRDDKGGLGVIKDGDNKEEGLRITKDYKGEEGGKDGDETALRELDRLIKLCFGEKTMLKNQMDKIEQMVGEQGLTSQNQRIAKAMAENRRKEQKFDDWLKNIRSGKHSNPNQ